LLLASFGVGALAGAAALPHVRERLSIDGLVAGAVLVFAMMTFALGQVEQFGWLCLVMFAAGLAWIGILACLNVTAQTMCPSWMRARALSMYLLVLQGGMAIGSAAWGALASRYGVPNAMMGASIALLVGLSTVKRHRLTAQDLELSPAVVRD
jgi:predicted MFS family arabinose efflux permease